MDTNTNAKTNSSNNLMTLLDAVSQMDTLPVASASASASASDENQKSGTGNTNTAAAATTEGLLPVQQNNPPNTSTSTTAMVTDEHVHEHEHEHDPSNTGLPALPLTKETFPVQLMRVVSNPKFHDVITFHDDGNLLVILQVKKFSKTVMVHEFGVTKLPSFTRRLSRWGFTQVRRVFPGQSYSSDSMSFYHPKFKQGEWEMCRSIRSANAEAQSAKAVRDHDKRVSEVKAAMIRSAVPPRTGSKPSDVRASLNQLVAESNRLQEIKLMQMRELQQREQLQLQRQELQQLQQRQQQEAVQQHRELLRKQQQQSAANLQALAARKRALLESVAASRLRTTSTSTAAAAGGNTNRPQIPSEVIIAGGNPTTGTSTSAAAATAGDGMTVAMEDVVCHISEPLQKEIELQNRYSQILKMQSKMHRLGIESMRSKGADAERLQSALIPQEAVENATKSVVRAAVDVHRREKLLGRLKSKISAEAIHRANIASALTSAAAAAAAASSPAPRQDTDADTASVGSRSAGAITAISMVPSSPVPALAAHSHSPGYYSHRSAASIDQLHLLQQQQARRENFSRLTDLSSTLAEARAAAAAQQLTGGTAKLPTLSQTDMSLFQQLAAARAQALRLNRAAKGVPMAEAT